MGFNLRRGLTNERQEEHARETSKLSDKIPVDGKTIDLNDKYICITGTIPGMTRFQASQALLKKYPRVHFDEHITINTNYLITGFGIGQTKLQKAKSLGIPMIESAKFFN